MDNWPEGVGKVVLDEIDSTNAEAQRRAAATARPTWIAARRQTAGRGRSGRQWDSPEGNLAATLIFRREEPPGAKARLSFHAALAVSDVIASYAPGAAVTLKWPNDVLLDGAKVSGILLESFSTQAPAANLAIGIGINLAHFPPEGQTRWRASSVAAATGHAPDPDDALTRLAARLAHWLAEDEAHGFEPIRSVWLARAAHLGRRIEARLPGSTLVGVFEDVTGDGALVLGTGKGRQVISAADIHFPD